LLPKIPVMPLVFGLSSLCTGLFRARSILLHCLRHSHISLRMKEIGGLLVLVSSVPANLRLSCNAPHSVRYQCCSSTGLTEDHYAYTMRFYYLCYYSNSVMQVPSSDITGGSETETKPRKFSSCRSLLIFPLVLFLLLHISPSSSSQITSCYKRSSPSSMLLKTPFLVLLASSLGAAGPLQYVQEYLGVESHSHKNLTLKDVRHEYVSDLIRKQNTTTSD